MEDRQVDNPAARGDSAGVGEAVAFDCSHGLRLSGRDWLIVAVVLLAFFGLAPVLWDCIEAFHPDSDYRIPYELSSDYWLYRRHCRRACDQGKVLVVGDSVVWGHYVPPEQSLTHYLNEISGGERFANLGLDGTHPAALEGLLRYYGGLSGRTVLLHLNPLWMSSARHDLQTTKEFHFNHAELVSQFTPKIPCYKAPFTKRLRIAVWRKVPFANWMNHVRSAYYGGMDLQTWTLEHPYRNPVMPLLGGLPPSAGVPEPSGGSWVDRGAKKQNLAWVELEGSLQWRFFRRAVELLQSRGNKVFVLVGPFNEHMLNDADTASYNAIKNGVEAWLHENEVPCFIPSPLPASHYVDASHPVGEGYALLARQLLKQPQFASWVAPITSED